MKNYKRYFYDRFLKMEKIDKLKDTNLHINMNCNREDMIIFYRFNNRFILNYKNKIIFEKGLNDHLINKKYSYFILMVKMLSTWRQYVRCEAKRRARQRHALRETSVEA